MHFRISRRKKGVSQVEEEVTLGEAIRAARTARHRKMIAVHRFVSASTINAIEHDRMCPSVSILDAISQGLELPTGVWDELYLDRATEPRQALEVGNRLLARPDPPYRCVRRNWLRLLRQSSRYPQVSAELLFALAMMDWRHGHDRRAIFLGRLLSQRAHEHHWTEIEIEARATVGRWLLLRNQSQEALPMLEAVIALPAVGPSWERSAYNVGVALWNLGQYEEAAHHWQTWQSKISQVDLRAHLSMGLGNVALARGQYSEAMGYFESAYTFYGGCADQTDHVIAALNNCLYTAAMMEDWEAAARWLQEAPQWYGVGEAYQWGELAGTQAEIAWKQGRVEDSRQYLHRAYDLLGDHWCRGWFTSRILHAEMALSVDDADTAVQRFDEVLNALSGLEDDTLRVALVIKAIDIASRAKPRSVKKLNASIRRFRALNTSYLY